METVQLLLVQPLVSEPSAPEPKRSDEFSDILAGQERAAQAESPPGQPPPAAAPAVGEAEITEPNAQSQEPDFHSHDGATLRGPADQSDGDRSRDSAPALIDAFAAEAAQVWVAAVALTPNAALGAQAAEQDATEAGSMAVPETRRVPLASTEEPESQTAVPTAELIGSEGEETPPAAPQPVQTEPAPRVPRDASAPDPKPEHQPARSGLRPAPTHDSHSSAPPHEAELPEDAPVVFEVRYEVLPEGIDPAPGAGVPLPREATAVPERSVPIARGSKAEHPPAPRATEAAKETVEPDKPAQASLPEEIAVERPKQAAETHRASDAPGARPSESADPALTETQDAEVSKAKPRHTEPVEQATKAGNRAPLAENKAANKEEPWQEAEAKAAQAPVSADRDEKSVPQAGPKPTASLGVDTVQPSPTASAGNEPVQAPRVAPAPDKAEPLSLSRTADVIRQVVDRVETLAAAHRPGGVVVRLEPQDLGTITLSVRSIGDQIEAHIAASDERVRNALDTSKSHLAQAMEAKGFSLRSVTVTESTATQSQAELANPNRGQQHQQPRQDQQAFRQQANMLAFAYARPSNPGARGGVVWTRQSGLDLWT